MEKSPGFEIGKLGNYTLRLFRPPRLRKMRILLLLLLLRVSVGRFKLYILVIKIHTTMRAIIHMQNLLIITFK